jgi:hypothetical protein
MRVFWWSAYTSSPNAVGGVATVWLIENYAVMDLG